MRLRREADASIYRLRQVRDQEDDSIFFFNDTATTEIYTLSLHDALPICPRVVPFRDALLGRGPTPHRGHRRRPRGPHAARRSEEHTSELQSRQYLVCRLLLEKTK